MTTKCLYLCSIEYNGISKGVFTFFDSLNYESKKENGLETIIAVSILCLGLTIGSLIPEKRESVETGRIGDICNIDPRKNNSQNESQKINTDSDLLNRCEEDEYWEIEKIGDTYYKVRREMLI